MSCVGFAWPYYCKVNLPHNCVKYKGEVICFPNGPQYGYLAHPRQFKEDRNFSFESIPE